MPRVVGNKTMLVCLKTRKKLLKVQSAPCFLSAKTVRRVQFYPSLISGLSQTNTWL